MLEGHHNEEEIRSYVVSQKQVIKKTQEKLEQAKKQYRDDKKRYSDEAFMKSNPEEYLRQKKTLDDVKV